MRRRHLVRTWMRTLGRGACLALWIAAPAQAARYDPLVLDLNGDGIDLANVVTTGLVSDEVVALHWTRGGTDDAFLMIDATSLRAAGFDVKDGDGNALDGDVVFRDGLRITLPGGSEIVTTRGWDLIEAFDSNADHVIDDRDPVWQHLKLFGDADGSGSADASETAIVSGSILKSFFETGDIPTEDQFGNLIDSGVFVRQDDSQGPMASVQLQTVTGEPVLAGADGEVAVLDETGGVSAALSPFGGYTGGVRVATGDVTGDGVADVIATLADDGSPSQVVVHDGATHALVASFLAFDPSYTGTARVGTVDRNNDGRDDLVVGAAQGLAHVRVIDGTKLSQVEPDGEIAPAALLGDFFAFSTSYTGGANVAAGDVNGDGTDDIVVGARTGLAHVRVIDGTKLSQVESDGVISSSDLLADFFAFSTSYSGGVNVACGDVDSSAGLGGDGLDDIVVGARVGLAHVRVVDAAAASSISGEASAADLLREFVAFPASYTGGVEVGSGDVNADAHQDVISGAAVGLAHVRVVDGASNPSGEVGPQSLLYESTPFGSQSSDGVHVAGAHSLPEPGRALGLAAGGCLLAWLHGSARRRQTALRAGALRATDPH